MNTSNTPTGKTPVSPDDEALPRTERAADSPSQTLRPIKSWEDAPKLPPDHWIYHQGPQVILLGGLNPSATQNEKNTITNEH